MMHIRTHRIALLTLTVLLSVNLSACKKKTVTDESVNMDGAMQEDAVMGNGEDAFVGTAQDLLKSGKDITCTFARNDEAGEMTGTVYVAKNGKMAGDFTMKNAMFGTATIHVIRDGEYGYTWGFPSETQGTKIQLDDAGKPMKKEKENGPSIDDPMEYRCAKWKMDAKKFAIPSNVEFKDMSEMLNAIDKQMKMIKGPQCAACDSLPAPGKEECKKALGCS